MSRSSPRFSRPVRIPWPRRAASTRRWPTCGRTTGTGTCSIPSRAATTWATRTPSSTCAAPHRKAVYELEHFGVPFSRLDNGTHLPAPVRRPEHELRWRAGRAHLRCGRPHRARHPAGPVPAEYPCTHAFLRRILRHRPARTTHEGIHPRRPGAGYRDRRKAGDRGQDHAAGHRRCRADLPHQHQCPDQHRRRHGHGAARRRAAAGHGILPVSSRPASPARAC